MAKTRLVRGQGAVEAHPRGGYQGVIYEGEGRKRYYCAHRHRSEEAAAKCLDSLLKKGGVLTQQPPIEQAMVYISRARELVIAAGDAGSAGPSLKTALNCLMEAQAERDYLRVQIARLEVERDEQGEH